MHAEKVTSRWSLSNSTLFLDELFESGVKLLESGPESSDENEQKNRNEEPDFVGSTCIPLTPESKDKQVRKHIANDNHPV